MDLSSLTVRPWGNRYVLSGWPDGFNVKMLDLYPGAFCSKKGNWILPHNAFDLSCDSLNYVSPAKIPPTTPNGLRLRDYQIEGTSRLVSSSSGHILMDDVGLGKTMQVLQALNVLGRDFFPYLVVSLKNSEGVWCGPNSDAERFFNYKTEVLRTRTFKIEDVAFDGVDGYFVNFNIVKDWDLSIIEWLSPRTIIVDECHEVRNIRTKAHKAIRKIVRASCVRKRFLLTATPIVNSLVDLYGQLDLAQPRQWGNFVLFNDSQKTSFGTRYCAGYMGEYGWILDGESNVAELQNRLANATTRRTQAEVGKDLPERLRKSYVVPKSDLDTSIYREARDGKYDKALPKHAKGAELQRLGRMAVASSMAKVPAVLDRCDFWLQAGRKRIVVLSYFQETAKSLVKASKGRFEGCRVLGPYCATTADKRRKKLLTSFAENYKFPQVFFATLKTVGTALNDLMVADTMLISDLFWVPIRFLQAEGRLVRIGQQAKTVNIEYVLADLEIDRKMFEHLERKARVMEIPRESDDGTTLVNFLGGALDADDTKDLLRELAAITDEDLELL